MGFGTVSGRALVVAGLTTLASAGVAKGGVVVYFSSENGLQAQVEFTLPTPTTLVVRARNLTPTIPVGFAADDVLLTTVGWDFGEVGSNAGDPRIVSGTVVIGPSSATVGFDSGTYGPGADVSGEWGFHNSGPTPFLTNLIGCTSLMTTRFAGPNLDSSEGLGGPQAGVASATLALPPDPLGVVRDEIIATLQLDGPVTDLDFTRTSQVTATFGLEKITLNAPAPGAASLAVAAVCGVMGRRRRS